MTKNDSQNRLIIIGHRGARGLAPENTIASLQTALENKVDMVEIDVHTTRDGAVLLNHDPHFVDKTGKKVWIHSVTHNDMKDHREDVLTLREAIEFIDKRVPMIIEVKPKVNAALVCDVVQDSLERGWTLDDLRFCSYSPRALQSIKEHFPTATLIMNEDWSSVRVAWRARRIGTKYVALYRRWLWSPVIRGLSHRGFQVYSFTVNNPAVARRWHRAGLAAVYTDRPDKFRYE